MTYADVAVTSAFLSLVLLSVGNRGAATTQEKLFRVGVILPFTGDYEWTLPKTKYAILYSIETIGNRSILPQHSLVFEFGDSRCSETHAPLQAIDMVFNPSRRPDIFLGPVCSYAVSNIARFSPHWGIPVATSGAMEYAFGDKKNLYSQLTRIGGTYIKLGRFLTGFYQSMQWNVTMLLYEANLGDRKSIGPTKGHFICEAIYLSMTEKFGRSTVKFIPFDRNAPPGDAHYQDLGTLLQEVSLRARIVVLCASPDSVREIMIRAAENGFTNGEYVFFNIDLFSSKEYLKKPWHRDNDTPARNNFAKAAFQSTLTVTLRNPENDRYNVFSEEVKRRSREEYGNNTYRADEEVNSFVTAFHDAVILYALALNETITRNEDPRNGTIITRRMWSRSFEGITGNVTIDENGDRNADYSLLDMVDPKSGEFKAVVNYYGSTKEYEFEKEHKIHWPNRTSGPPPDTPVCGFDNSKCKGGIPPWGYVIIVLVVLLLFVTSLAGVFIWRERVRRKTMSEKYWRVIWSEIKSSPLTNKRRTSVVSLRGNHDEDDTVTLGGDIRGHQFIPTGFYKGEWVAVKKVNRSVARQTTKMDTLKEIKKLRDLQNDHLVRFIGVCIDEGHESIVTAYCQKGSLEDVLEDEKVSLDTEFKLSLILDIVRGLCCLHGSEIRFHGNLKTSNCVVDSRFVVKLTDFGLHFVRCQESTEDIKAYSQWKSKLWMAPELLRDQKISSPELRQKGDAYAFAIICQEILYRKGPFWVEDYENQDPEWICEQVVASDRQPFRPTLREYFDNMFFMEDLLKMIGSCWANDPMERPDFNRIKSTCNKIYKRIGGDSGNIMDSLLKRMELYANNLEDLVEQKTASYLEEKKKAQDLLYAMIPESVAKELMTSGKVTAEEFKSVTIYFSDICGFTDLSAASSPMEVVNLLNKLYKTFDDIIDLVDVYKVETIGDAYMVVSGLPDRKITRHAEQISRMALLLLKAIHTFEIPHRKNEVLKLRIGIHSGMVCAGVVGNKMPRYCLFGDTVNTASRMESNGAPLRIHVSPQTKELLDTFETFVTELRGPVEMKGKGTIVTWWLLGELNPKFPDLAPCRMIPPQSSCSVRESDES